MRDLFPGATSRILMHASGRATAVAIVLLATTVLWFRHNAPPGRLGLTFPFDLMFYYYPMTEYSAERIARGEVPLWNPYPCCGVPFLATAQVGVFYPAAWLALVMPVDTAFKVMLFGQVLLAGLFAAMFFRSLGVGHYAAGIGGMLFVFACILGQTFWPPQVSTIAWLPFLFLCVERVIQQGGFSWWVGFTLGAALQLLAGFPQFLVYTFYLLLPYATFRLIQHRAGGGCPPAQALKRAAALAAGGALAVGLAGIQLLPTLELAKNTVRSRGMGAEDVHYIDRDQNLPTIGQALHNAVDPKPRLIAFDISSDTSYLGIGTLVMIAVGVFCHRRYPLAGFFLAAAVIFFLLSFGYRDWSGPLYKLYQYLPTGSMFRTPSRFGLLTYFSLITVAVFGIEEFSAGWTGPSRGCWSAVPLIAACGILVAVVAVVSSSLARVLVAITAGLLVASMVAPRHRLLRAGLQVLFLGVLLFDLAHATAPHGSLRDIPVKYGQCVHFKGDSTMIAADLYERFTQLAGLNRVYVHLTYPTKTIQPLGRAYTICEYEALQPERWRRLNEAVEGSPLCTLWGVDPNRLESLFDITSVKYMMVPASPGPTAATRGAPPQADANPHEPVVTQRSTVLPRAYLVGRYTIRSAEEALSMIVRGSFNHHTTVVLEKDPGMPQAPTESPCTSAEILSYAPERVVISAECDGERLLVLTDTWFPGWRARVDGRGAEILRANYLFRAVRLPTGHHEVVFDYRPSSFRMGAALSGLSLLILMGFCGVRWYRSRQPATLDGVWATLPVPTIGARDAS